MVRSLVGAVLAAVLGALVGAGGLTFAYLRAPGVDLPFDRPHPQVLTGFYNLERSGDLTFAWTGPRATVLLPGLDRAVPWQCRARLRGARAAGIAQPTVAIDVDGVPATRTVATNDYEDIDIDVPARPGRDDLALTIASEPTFVPGPGDRRELGVQVDHIACAPTAGSPSPPRGALVAATTSAAFFGAAFAAAGRAALALAAGRHGPRGRAGAGDRDGTGALHALSRSRADAGARDVGGRGAAGGDGRMEAAATVQSGDAGCAGVLGGGAVSVAARTASPVEGRSGRLVPRPPP